MTTITTPASTRDLVSLDDVREQLSIKSTDTSPDTWLAKVLTRASRQAEQYCNRIFAEQTYQDYFGPLSLDASTPLQLGQAPATTVVITVDNGASPLDDSQFLVDGNVGLIYWIGDAGGWSAMSNITIAYNGGFETIPDDVQQAVIELCVLEFRGRGRDPMLRERETPGIGRESFWIGPPPGGATAMPADIGALLDPYRRGLIG
jgi:hypothetical protein